MALATAQAAEEVQSFIAALYDRSAAMHRTERGIREPSCTAEWHRGVLPAGGCLPSLSMLRCARLWMQCVVMGSFTWGADGVATAWRDKATIERLDRSRAPSSPGAGLKVIKVALRGRFAASTRRTARVAVVAKARVLGLIAGAELEGSSWRGPLAKLHSRVPDLGP